MLASLQESESSVGTFEQVADYLPSFEQLIEDHLPMVRSIVDRMKRRLPQIIEAEELHSVGVTGLVAAARNFRADHQNSFATYAATRIRGAILDELRRMDWMSRAKRSKAKQLDSVISRLEQEYGGAVSQDALCAEMQMCAEELSELMDELRPVRLISLDNSEDAAENENASLHEIIADDTAASALDVIERKEMIALLAQKIETMPEMPKKVLAMYYFENMRLSEIAACFNLTESRICQIHTQAVGQLRHYLFSVLN
jgi:RNA polymerase sigma factor FliA